MSRVAPVLLYLLPPPELLPLIFAVCRGVFSLCARACATVCAGGLAVYVCARVCCHRRPPAAKRRSRNVGINAELERTRDGHFAFCFIARRRLLRHPLHERTSVSRLRSWTCPFPLASFGLAHNHDERTVVRSPTLTLARFLLFYSYYCVSPEL